MTLEPPIPVLRIFDHALARKFYLDWLGFTVDWEFQSGPGGPHYLQISRGPVVLHLTEHYGDCSPGAKVFINTDDVEALHRELHSRPNPNMNPGVELAPGTRRSWTSSTPLATGSASISRCAPLDFRPACRVHKKCPCAVRDAGGKFQPHSHYGSRTEGGVQAPLRRGSLKPSNVGAHLATPGSKHRRHTAEVGI